MNIKKPIAVIAAGAMFSIVGTVQAAESRYAASGKWSIVSESENGQHLGCTAELKRNNSGFEGTTLRIGIIAADNQWIIATNSSTGGIVQDAEIQVDKNFFPSSFVESGKWVGAKVSPALLAALKKGTLVNLQLGPDGPAFFLPGSNAAITKVTECIRNKGSLHQNASTQPADAISTLTGTWLWKNGLKDRRASRLNIFNNNRAQYCYSDKPCVM